MLPGEWAQLRRADLERLIRRARQVAATALLDAGDWMAAADAAAAALEYDPYDEAALRVLLRAQVMGGRVAAALATYASTRERLADELGTDPSPETEALQLAILRGELVPPAPAPPRRPWAWSAGMRNWPIWTPWRCARHGARAEAGASAEAEASVEVVVIEGEAGIGKTTLLRTWAGRRAAAGDTVLVATCGQLDRAMPLDGAAGRAGRAAAPARARGGRGSAGGRRAAARARAGPGPGPAARPERGRGRSWPTACSAPRSCTRPWSGCSAGSPRGGRWWWRSTMRIWRAPRCRTGCTSCGARPCRWPWWPRSGPGGRALPATGFIHLGVLGRDAAAELVGPARVDELYERSKGHPLFLTELAQQAAGGTLPASLVESVSARCDELGSAGALLRTAAVIGPELDIDLLAAVLGRGAVELLDDAERAVAGQFLADEGGTLRFRHELLREALAASATAGRAALLHRQAGRVLARRPDADPMMVAHHARLGGDLALASRALRDASARAGERFDHAAAEALLDDALLLHPDQEGWLARARVRTRRGRYPEALEDVQRAGVAGPAALEVGAWASYFGRRFRQAAQFAEDGALAAVDPVTRARCLAVGGRTHHAAGDLARAEQLLGEAFSLAEGADRVTAAAWLGVLRAHQSRTAEALPLLRPAARGHVGVEHTSATLHALLFTGHAHALAGRPAQALAAFARYTEEAERRQVPRFSGRAVNFAGWVLRNLGAAGEAADQHAAALEIAQQHGTAEVTIAALEDLAEQCLDAGDPDGARARLAEAAALLAGRPGLRLAAGPEASADHGAPGPAVR